MDEREDGLRYSRENDEIFKKQFEELSKSYSQNPHSLRKVSFPKPYQQYNSNSYNNMYPNYYQYPYYNSNYDYDYPQKNNYYSPYQQQRDDYYKPKYNSNAEPFFYQEKNQKYEEEEEEEKR